MKMMLKLLAMLTALMMLCSFAFAEEEEATGTPDSSTQSLFVDDSGDWTLDLLWYNSGNMFVSIEHRTEDSTADIWSFSIGNAFEGDSFDYIDAYKGHATLDSEDGSLGDVETVYEDGTGSIALDGDVITWTNITEDYVLQFGLSSSSTTTNYTDAEQGKAELSATSTTEDNSELTVLIEWPISDTETRVWTMTLLWDDDQNMYVYQDAVCTKQVTVNEEYSEETLYSDGQGTFALMADSSLVWTDNADGTGTGCRFTVNMLEN